MTDRIRDLIRENPNLNAIRQEAVKGGMKYLQEDGLMQVIEGRTSMAMRRRSTYAQRREFLPSDRQLREIDWQESDGEEPFGG